MKTVSGCNNEIGKTITLSKVKFFSLGKSILYICQKKKKTWLLSQRGFCYSTLQS